MIAFARQLYNQIKSLPERVRRGEFEEALVGIPSIGQDIMLGTVLVDGMWDNPNHWIRYSMLHALNRKDPSARHGFLGEHNKRSQRKTLANFGIISLWDCDDHTKLRQDINGQAREFVRSATSADDILEWKLPYAIPGSFLYDYILKRQRAPTVDFDDPVICKDVRTFLGYCYTVERILMSVEPATIVTSHVTGLHSPMAWIGLGLGAEVVVPASAKGIFNFTRMKAQDDILDEATSVSSLSLFSNVQKMQLARVGGKVMKDRLSGLSNDFSGKQSFGSEKAQKQVSKESMCREFGWSPDRPIIGLYTHCWYDWPHSSKMNNFRDFNDWVNASLEVAIDTDEFNWLLRPHPGEHWYGGPFLQDLVKPITEQHSHIKMVKNHWHGMDLLNSVDAVVTVHGTIGLEASSGGVPTLVADQGWYDHLGFVKRPKDRQHYLQLLGGEWWQDMDMEGFSRRANISAGALWGRPDWQKKTFIDEDDKQWEIYGQFLSAIKEEPGLVEDELRWLSKWYHSGHRNYHTFKMQQSDDYI